MIKSYRVKGLAAATSLRLLRLVTLALFCLGLSTPQPSIGGDAESAAQVAHGSGTGLAGPIALTAEEQAWLDRKLTVRARVGNAPPYQMATPEPAGISVDYLKLIGQRFGITFVFVTSATSWPEAVDDLIGERREFDLLVTMKNSPERAQKIAFTSDYLFSPWVIINRSDASFVSRMEDLNGKKVALEQGYVIKDRIVDEYPQVAIVEFTKTIEALHAVATGRADAYIGNLTIASYLIKNHGLTNLKIAAPTPFGNHDQAMGVRSDWPELATLLDKALAAMSDEEKSDILNRWLSVRYEYGINTKEVLSWIGVLIAAFSLVIGMTVIWNRRLSREVLQRTRAEQSLRENEAFIHAVMENLPIGIAVNSVDPTVHFAYMNENFANYYRTTKAAIGAPGDFWAAVYEDPVFREEIKIRVLEDCATGDPRRMYWTEVPITRKGQETTFISAMNTPLSDKKLMISTVWDVTEQKLTEEANAKLEAQLLQAQKMESVGQLAGGVAHDFNNMLGVILGHAEMAMEQVDRALPLYADLEEIHKAAERSADITRQLLAFARKQTIAPKILDLNETLEGMLKMLRRLIGEDIDLAWQPGNNLWPVKMDPSQIDQILANLCVNARDSITGVGKITVSTKNSTFDEGDCTTHPGFVAGEYIRISVSDTGCGMDRETLAHIFEPFFTTKVVGQGTGLGLATVYGAIKQNNGFINAYSEPGQGTTFAIYLPRYIGEVGQPSTEPATESAARGRETILLVEDEPTILNMTRTMLERLGYTVLPAGTPGQAIHLLGDFQGEIHLLISDVIMPEMNGWDLAQRLMAKQSGMKCLFMSGYTAEVISHHGVLDHGVSFIQKPFAKKELAAKIRQVLAAVP